MLKPQLSSTSPKSHFLSTSPGFTLLEVLVALILVGIVAAIAAPSWLHLMKVMSLNTAQDQVLQAMRKAQHNARLSRIVWEFGIRQTPEGKVQWAIYPDQAEPAILIWNELDSHIQLDAETTLRNVRGVRRVQFSHRGTVNGALGTVTLSAKSGGKTKRCVVVSTLLGTLRTGSDQARPKEGKYCR